MANLRSADTGKQPLKSRISPRLPLLWHFSISRYTKPACRRTDTHEILLTAPADTWNPAVVLALDLRIAKKKEKEKPKETGIGSAVCSAIYPALLADKCFRARQAGRAAKGEIRKKSEETRKNTGKLKEIRLTLGWKADGKDGC